MHRVSCEWIHRLIFPEHTTFNTFGLFCADTMMLFSLCIVEYNKFNTIHSIFPEYTGTLAQIQGCYSLSLLLSAALCIFTHEPIFETVLFPFFTRAFSENWILSAFSQNYVVFHGLFWAFTRMTFALSISCHKSLFSKLYFFLERFFGF